MTITVVPHAGTWIEIDGRDAYDDYMTSFPTRERGLKYGIAEDRRQQI